MIYSLSQFVLDQIYDSFEGTNEYNYVLRSAYKSVAGPQRFSIAYQFTLLKMLNSHVVFDILLIHHLYLPYSISTIKVFTPNALDHVEKIIKV